MMSDNSSPAQVGADNGSIVLFVASMDGTTDCALCGQSVETHRGNVTAAHLNGYWGGRSASASGIICRSCLVKEAPSLHKLLKPDYPGRVVKQTIAHHTELGDGSIITRTYEATDVDTKLRDGAYRLKARGTLVSEEVG